MPGLQARSLVGRAQEATYQCISHTLIFLYLSFFLRSPLSKKINKIFYKNNMGHEDVVSLKKKLLPFATTWMELESIMLSEISQAVKDKYHMISPLTGT